MLSVDYERDPSRIVIVESSNRVVRVGVPSSFIVDATLTALEPVSVRFCDGSEPQPIVEEVRPRIYRVTFTPRATTRETIALELLYGGELIGE